MTFLSELRELEAKATDGPWGVGMRNGANANGVYSYTGADYHDDQTICSVYGIHMHRNRYEVKGCDGYPNAELIAYLRNHSKEIINLVEAAEEVHKRWEAPNWKDAEPTAHTMNKMRDALAALNKEQS
jgi:hypothetical protein